MRRMRVKNDPKDLEERFLWCRHQKNQPRVHYKICENCPLKNTCRDYKSFLLKKELIAKPVEKKSRRAKR